MPDQPADQDWQHQQHHSQQQNNYIPPMPMLTNQWAPQTQPQSAAQQQRQMLGLSGMDRRFFHEENSSYMPYTGPGASNNLISPGFPPESTWSDMDIGTPSYGSPNDPLDSYSQSQTDNTRLRLPSNATAKHHTPSLSPHLDGPDPMSLDQHHHQQQARPSLPGRSQTAPAGKNPHSTKSSKDPTIKSSISDENEAESDEDFVPSSESATKHLAHPAHATNPTTASNRGRKRQRIPHTAVERRYRENLNAHLERLRQTVPSLASRPPPPSSAPHHAPQLLADSARPSKCEILNGAIEHIGGLQRENDGLKGEVKELRARVEELQRWCSAALGRAGAPQGGGMGVGFAG
ncbi:hypothetical protein WHR41_08468 [Cladosporium halotolerans]|uniref:BHLH domain-containing protein n=1 Tax=Cladosporium halotolerans TaxID=1052096 RepID=A0AB34KDF5_9PEZI